MTTTDSIAFSSGVGHAAALAQTSLNLTFNGQVVPYQRTQVANQINGVVNSIHFKPGQRVGRGDLL